MPGLWPVRKAYRREDDINVVGVTEFGGPDALRCHDVPDPHPGKGEARIRVLAAAVNPTDTHVRCGTFGRLPKGPPYVPGMDAAGVIDEVGSGCPWEVGDEVMAIALPTGEHGGAYAEHLVGPWESMARIPSGCDAVAASTIPMNGLTAVQTLDALALVPGQVLAVTGAAGTLGSYIVALAKRAGLTVVADSADKDRSWVESLGADHVVPRGENVADAIRALFPHGVHRVADAAVLDTAIVPAIADHGRLATTRFWQGPNERGIKTHAVQVREEYRSHAKLNRVRALVEDGTLPVRVAGTLPAHRAPEAHQRLEAGGLRGRLVLRL